MELGERRAGPARGLRARRWENGKGLAGQLGWLAWAELLAVRPSLFISLFPFLFYFSSPLFKFQIDLKFEFKIGVP